MKEYKIDLDALEKSQKIFRVALFKAEKIEEKDEQFLTFPEEDYEFDYILGRSNVIHHFEICYEQAWKLIQRWLVVYDMGDEAKRLNRKDLYRKACEKGLIDDVLVWFDFHDTRNLTSHIYDEDIAEQAYKTAKNFDNFLSILIERLKEKI